MSTVMRRRFVIVLGLALLLLALIVAFNLFKAYMIKKALAKNAAPPQTVSTLRAAYTDWQPEVTSVGSLRAVRGVDITTEVTGLVREVRFKSGQDVAGGTALVELNADQDIAQLHSLQADAEIAQTTYERDKIQYEAQAISKEQLETDEANVKSRRALAASQAALVAKKTLRAPFCGRLGITTVNPGQYLNTGDKVVTLQEIDQLFVDFNLPQQQLPRISVGQVVHVTTDTFPGEIFEGKVSAIDPRVDPSTRNFQVEGTVPNASKRLLPGMFARAAVQSGGKQRYLTLPQTAITYNPYGSTVFIVQEAKHAGEKPTVLQTFVTTGSTRGDQVAVLTGLKEGDVIVSSGQLKLKNGTPIDINNSVQPKNDPNPTPQEE